MALNRGDAFQSFDNIEEALKRAQGEKNGLLCKTDTKETEERKMRSVILTQYQKEKLEYYFKFLASGENVINRDSIDRLMDRILDFTGWDEDGTVAKECREVHGAFFEILFEKIKEEAEEDEAMEGVAGPTEEVTMAEWLSMWSSLLYGVMGMPNFPIWLRLVPKLLFTIVDRRRQGYLTANDLEIFYKEMVNVDPDLAKNVAQLGYNQMTDFGRYPLREDSYEQLFANFLIGKTPYGPGRFIFGCFEHKVRPFQLIQPAPEPDDDDHVEIRTHFEGRRPSRQLMSFK